MGGCHSVDHTPCRTECQGSNVAPLRDSKTPANNVAPKAHHHSLSLPHQHGLHGPHLHVLPRQPPEARHQGQPVGLGAATWAPAPVAAGPAPGDLPWPDGSACPRSGQSRWTCPHRSPGPWSASPPNAAAGLPHLSPWCPGAEVTLVAGHLTLPGDASLSVKGGRGGWGPVQGSGPSPEQPWGLWSL